MRCTVHTKRWVGEWAVVMPPTIGERSDKQRTISISAMKRDIQVGTPRQRFAVPCVSTPTNALQPPRARIDHVILNAVADSAYYIFIYRFAGTLLVDGLGADYCVHVIDAFTARWT